MLTNYAKFMCGQIDDKFNQNEYLQGRMSCVKEEKLFPALGGCTI